MLGRDRIGDILQRHPHDLVPQATLLTAPCRGGMGKYDVKIPGTSLVVRAITMANKLRADSSVTTQIKMLGRLAAKLDSDPRHPIDVFEQFFGFDLDQQDIFLRAFYDRDDPILVSK
jgi:hypothetical protein